MKLSLLVETLKSFDNPTSFVFCFFFFEKRFLMSVYGCGHVWAPQLECGVQRTAYCRWFSSSHCVGSWDWTKVIRLDAFTLWTNLLSCFQRCLGFFFSFVFLSPVLFCTSEFICYILLRFFPKYLFVEWCSLVAVFTGSYERQE